MGSKNQQQRLKEKLVLKLYGITTFYFPGISNTEPYLKTVIVGKQERIRWLYVSIANNIGGYL